MTRETSHLNTADITIGEQNLRELEFDDGIIELAADIASRGLLQPIGVHPIANQRWQLRWGKRRLLAHVHLRRTTIEAFIVDADAPLLIGDAFAENLHRRQLSLAEECNGIAHLHQSGRSPDQIAGLMGKSRQWVLRRLSIPGLPPELRNHVLDGTLAIGSAEALALLEDEAGRNLILTESIHAKWTTDQIKAATNAWRANAVTSDPTTHDTDSASCGPVSYPTLLRNCAACGTLRQPGDLTLIMICAAGCPAHTPDAPRVATTDNNGGPG